MTAEANGGSQIHELVGKAVQEPDFAARLLDREQQAEALREVGIDPTDEVLHELNHSLHHLRQMWEAFGGNYKMAS